MIARRRRLVMSAAGCSLMLALVPWAGAATGGGRTSAGNLAQAQSEATQLLGLLQLPVGAVPSANGPAGDHGVLAQPGYNEATPNLVDARAWWTVPGAASGVLAHVIAQLPADATLSTQGSGTAAPGYQTESFSRPAIAGVLSERVLAVTVEQPNAHTTAVRTDGEAVWITVRPAWEQIPPSVTSVTYTSSGSSYSGTPGRASTPVTLNGAGARRLVGFVNRLDLERLGAISRCSMTQLVPSAGLPGRNGAFNSRAISFTFRNRSRSVCRASGFPTVRLLDAQGHPIHTSSRDLVVTIVRSQGLDASAVLDPGQSASFSADFMTCEARTAARVRITLPRVGRGFILPVGSSQHPLAPCHGQLGLSNLQ